MCLRAAAFPCWLTAGAGLSLGRKRRAVAVELKTSTAVSGTQRMPDWSGSVQKSYLAV